MFKYKYEMILNDGIFIEKYFLLQQKGNIHLVVNPILRISSYKSQEERLIRIRFIECYIIFY